MRAMYHRQSAIAKAAAAHRAGGGRPVLGLLALTQRGFSELMAKAPLVVARLEPSVRAKRAEVLREKVEPGWAQEQGELVLGISPQVIDGGGRQASAAVYRKTRERADGLTLALQFELRWGIGHEGVAAFSCARSYVASKGRQIMPRGA